MIKINNIQDILTLDSLPNKFEHNGATYEVGNSSARSMVQMLVQGKEGDIQYSCFGGNVPKDMKTITITFKRRGLLLAIDTIQYGRI